MSRDSLKSLKNKTVTVTGQVEYITITPKIHIPNKPIFSKILLTDVNIGGQYFDHGWVYAAKRYYHDQDPFLHQVVKFKSKVTPYVKHGQHGYVEDYGIDYVKSLSILPNTSIEEYDERYYDDDITVDFFLTN